ncbi:IclR family transcriptional regulator [uncultured Roseovarius sp.]|uniref:IclR family transcriptional regulator n=1 Tax=uncultured Roseovarius sp. TaxID=293344 RepID=UPI00260EAEEA|nr:IclR family transcriptional regulator [uncultured Roseovarius sp.]
MHLDRLVTILETIAMAGRPITTGEIQKATGLPRPTCYRLLQTLADQRLIDDPGRQSRYVIGQRLMRIALSGKSDGDVCRASGATLRAAASSFGETVFLSRFRGDAVEIIHVEVPQDATRDHIHPGLGRRPLHACSCARAIAAFSEPDFQDHILRGSLTQYTEHTKSTPGALRAEFAEITKRGYAECDQEIDLGIASVAAPVMVGTLGATFSIGAVGPVRRFDKASRQRVGQELITLSTRISGAIQLAEAA